MAPSMGAHIERAFGVATVDAGCIDGGGREPERAFAERNVDVGYVERGVGVGTVDVARQWDEVERELLVLAKGVAAANLKRKHRLGRALLDIYAMLGSNLKRGFYSELRPYYDEMKRAYLRRRKKSAKSEAAAAD